MNDLIFIAATRFIGCDVLPPLRTLAEHVLLSSSELATKRNRPHRPQHVWLLSTLRSSTQVQQLYIVSMATALLSSSLCLLAASKPTPKVHSITFCVQILHLAFLLSIVLYHISSLVQSVCFQQQQFPLNQLWWTHCSLPAQHQNSRQTQRETRCDEESISSQIFSSGSGGDQTRSKRRVNIWNKHDSSVSLSQLSFLENLFENNFIRQQ